MDAHESRVQIETLIKSRFPLHCACREGDMDHTGSLLAAGHHSVHAEDIFYGWTPIHWASYFGKHDCLMKLIEHGASCDVPTIRFQQTPLHMSAFSGRVSCLKWLLHYGASVEREDHLGETAVHKSARTGQLDCLYLLATHNASLTSPNKQGCLPSMLAAMCGLPDSALYIEHLIQQQQLMKSSTGESSGLQLPAPPSTPTLPNAKPDERAIRFGLNGGVLPLCPPDQPAPFHAHCQAVNKNNQFCLSITPDSSQCPNDVSSFLSGCAGQICMDGLEDDGNNQCCYDLVLPTECMQESELGLRKRRHDNIGSTFESKRAYVDGNCSWLTQQLNCIGSCAGGGEPTRKPCFYVNSPTI